MQHGLEPARGVREVFGGHHICGVYSLRLFLEINEAVTSLLETLITPKGVDVTISGYLK